MLNLTIDTHNLRTQCFFTMTCEYGFVEYIQNLHRRIQNKTWAQLYSNF